MKIKVVPDPQRVIVRSSSSSSVDSHASSVPVEVSSKPKNNAPLNSEVKQTNKKSTVTESPTTAKRKTKNKKGTTKKKTQLRQRRVQFAEERNECFVDALSKDERSHLWYTTKEIISAKNKTMSLVKRVVEHQEADKNGWMHSLRRAYKGFCEANDVARVEQIIAQHQKTPIKATTTGLEKWAVRNMANDRIKRRKELWSTLIELQKQPFKNERQKANELRLASREITRPSRLFAHHAAQLGMRQKEH